LECGVLKPSVDPPGLNGRDLVRRRFSISSNVIPGFVGALDSVVILTAGVISFFAIVSDHVTDAETYTAAICFVWLTTILLMNFGGLYQFNPVMRPIAILDKIVVAFGTTILFLVAAAYALKVSAELSRVWLGSFAIGACLATITCRMLAAQVVGRLADRRVFSRNIVIVGTGEQARLLLRHFAQSPPRFISIQGLFIADPGKVEDDLAGYPILGHFDDLAAHARAGAVDDVIIALPWSADEKIVSMVNKLRELPMNVYLASDIIGFRLPLRPPPDHFGELSLVEVMGRPMAGWGALQKAALDYGLGLILTVMFLPVMAVIATAIKLDSRGPVLFRQERYGFVNQVFRICKFRTMAHTETPEHETVQASPNDPRFTRIGRFLRRTSLDELPQLFNVLGGTMSLVGPRPLATDHNEAYSQVIRGYFARHRVKPGLTGWAQVHGLRGEIKCVQDLEARVKYDIHYTENWSLALDLRILVMTLWVVLRGRNAY
jgi:Undecaprenyl-phosphate glucose phosphotransferase